MPIIVGFWNVQRATSPDSKIFDTSARAGLMSAYLEDLIGLCDVVILAEVTQNGVGLATDIAGKFKVKAEFVAVADRNGQVSPCSFLVISKVGMVLGSKIIGDTKRPMVLLELSGPIFVVGCHIIATRGEKSADEIFTMLTELSGHCSRRKCGGMLIGDMNYSVSDTGELTASSRVTPVVPCRNDNPAHAIDKTFKHGDIIDYAWPIDLKIRSVPSLAGPYSDWDVIDHAPIAYQIG